MAKALDSLPEDVETLKRILVGKEALIAQLTAEIMRLKRATYGQSSERIDPDLQPQLALNGLAVPPVADSSVRPVIPALESTRTLLDPAKRRRRLRALPDHLPRRTIIHAPKVSCMPGLRRSPAHAG
jgi:transposase